MTNLNNFFLPFPHRTHDYSLKVWNDPTNKASTRRHFLWLRIILSEVQAEQSIRPSMKSKIETWHLTKYFTQYRSILPWSCLLHYQLNIFLCFVDPFSPDHSLCLQYIWKVGWFRAFGCSRLAEARCRKSLFWRHSRKQTSRHQPTMSKPKGRRICKAKMKLIWFKFMQAYVESSALRHIM